LFINNKSKFHSYLATGRIAFLSPLAAVNAFVRRVRWAGTFACGRYATMDRHRSPSSAPSRGKPGTHLIHGLLGSHVSAAQTTSRSVQLFFDTAHPCAQHTDAHTDHATCDICSNRPHLRTACMRGALFQLKYCLLLHSCTKTSHLKGLAIESELSLFDEPCITSY